MMATPAVRSVMTWKLPTKYLPLKRRATAKMHNKAPTALATRPVQSSRSFIRFSVWAHPSHRGMEFIRPIRQPVFHPRCVQPVRDRFSRHRRQSREFLRSVQHQPVPNGQRVQRYGKRARVPNRHGRVRLKVRLEEHLIPTGAHGVTHEVPMPLCRIGRLEVAINDICALMRSFVRVIEKIASMRLEQSVGSVLFGFKVFQM